MPTQDQRQLRRQTQWHPPFNQSQGPPNNAFMNRYSQPDMDFQPPVHQPADHRSPSSTLTSDPYICLVQSINESNTKLHSAIIKQQEILVNQQKFFTEYLITKSTLQKEQTNLMHKQLHTILALAPSKERVPPAHFQPSSVHGISFVTASNKPDQPPLSQEPAPQPPSYIQTETPLQENQSLPYQPAAPTSQHRNLPRFKAEMMMPVSLPFNPLTKTDIRTIKLTSLPLTNHGFKTMHQKLACGMGT